MLKKLLSIVATSALLATILPMTAFAGFATFITDIEGTLTETDGDNNFEPENDEIVDFDLTFDLAISADATVTAAIVKGVDVVKLYPAVVGVDANPLNYEWDGKDSDASYCGDAATSCPAGTYSFAAHVVNVAGDTQDIVQDFTVTASAPAITIDTFEADVTGSGDFDPSPKGQNEDMEFDYTLSGQASSITLLIEDSDNNQLTDTPLAQSNKTTGTFTWSGIEDNNLVDPGVYTATLFVQATPSSSVVTDETTFTVAYDDSDKPTISDFTVEPSPFNPDDEDTTIRFQNDEDTDKLSVFIEEDDGDVIATFNDYKDDNFDANTDHDIDWDGDKDAGGQAANGTYTVVVRAESDYGVVIEEETVELNDNLSSAPSSNSHISGIDLDPSSTFEPAEDDELVIQYDVKKDLDDLKIYAVKGSEKIELEDDSNVDKESNLETTWDGTDDDDEYVEEGTWKIRFESSVGSTDLVAEKSIKLKFDEPQIEDFELSKDEIDTEIGETTYIIFRTDKDAEVDILVFEDGDEEDEIEEDLEVEGDKWYAIEWDGNSYDNSDDDKDIEIKLVAKTIGGSASDSEKRDIEFKEDDVSSSKANITNDYISPAIADSGDDMSIFYELEDDADVTITIHKGTSGSGSSVIELIDDKSQDADDYEIEWNGKDDDGDKLKDGLYSYKIVSKDKSTETEVGVFAIGDIGDEDSSSSSSSNNNSNVSSNVKIVSGDGGTSSGDCGGYSDVSDYSENCDALAWVTSEGIFQGYADGTFKPYQAINRVEVLKVLLEGLGLTIIPSDGTNLGFSDVGANEWYMTYIKTAKTFGIFSGDGGTNTARPGSTINRAELIKLAFETLKSSTGYNIGTCSSSYSDVPASAWYKNYACSAYEYALFSSTQLNAGKLSTRGEVAEMLYDLHLAGLI